MKAGSDSDADCVFPPKHSTNLLKASHFLVPVKLFTDREHFAINRIASS